MQVLGRGGVPSTGVAAVILCLTGVDATPGFLTLWPGGSPLPNVSNANFDHAGQVRANLAMVPVGASGTVSIMTSAGAHVLADVAGYVTDSHCRELVEWPVCAGQPSAPPRHQGHAAGDSGRARVAPWTSA